MAVEFHESWNKVNVRGWVQIRKGLQVSVENIFENVEGCIHDRMLGWIIWIRQMFKGLADP